MGGSRVRFAISLLIDVICIVLASVAAVILRDSFEFSSARLVALAPYFICTTFASVLVLAVSGVNRSIWRLSAMPDYLRIVASMLVVTIVSVAMTFAFNRLEGVPRSLPFLQFYLAVTLLVGSRVLYRLRHASRLSVRRGMAPLKVVDKPAAETVLLIGLSQLTETYLQSVAELAPGRYRVAGILGRHKRHVGRLVAAHKVLGLPEQLGRVLAELEVNGVEVDRIVVTAALASLSEEACEAIMAVQRSGSAEVQYLSEALGFETGARRQISDAAVADRTFDGRPVEFEIQADELAKMQKRRYWRAKRAIDVGASLFLLVIGAPVLMLIALSVAGSMGGVPYFWQQRPGLGGRPFRLYKFRTMRTPIAADGRKLSDEERLSRLGNFLRRTRFDELPQLFNILRGDMSFIGPRPLLPCDQDEGFRARLLVRPGLSGWAQVVGGRAISPEDKAALDVWYVRNAGFLLDFAIVLRTIPIIFLGERTSERLIDRAWQDLRRAGVLRGRFAPPIDIPSTPAA